MTIYAKKSATWLGPMICLSSGLFFMYEFIQLSLFNEISQLLQQTYHINAVQLSWMYNAYSFFNVLFLLPAGIILDRYSTRWVIVTILFICVLGTFGFAMTQSFRWAIFFHGLTGIGNAFCLAASIILVSNWVPNNRQAFYIGLMVTMAYLGGILAEGPFLRLIDHFGWRNAILIDGTFGTVILIWILMIVRDRPSHAVKQVSDARPSSLILQLKGAAWNSQNWFAGLYIALMNLPVMILGTLWGLQYLKRVDGVNDLAASRLISLFFIGCMIGCPLVGWISDNIGRRKPIMIIGAICLTLIYISLLSEQVWSKTALIPLFFLIGLFCSTQIIGYPLISESNHTDSIAKATSIATFLVMTVGAIGVSSFSLILSFNAHDFETYTRESYQYAVWLFPTTSLLALFMTFFIRETHCKRK